MTEAKRLLAVLFVLVLGVGGVACGSDSDSGNDGSSESSQATEIEGKTWTLMNVASQGSATSLPNNIEAPTLEFSDGSVQVFSGCNNGSGTAEIGEDSIDFGPIALTKKACAGTAGQIEPLVTQSLNGAVPYKLDQGSLVLENPQISLIFTEK